MVESQIDQLQKDSLGKHNKRAFFLYIAISAPKWLKVAAQQKVDFLVFTTHY